MTFEIPITEDVPDGTYTGMLEGVENLPSGGFQNAPYRRWRWLVDVPRNGETAIIPLTALTSQHNGPQSKSYKILTAILGAPPKAGTLEAPTGKRVLLKVTHNEKNFPTVSEVLPYTDPQVTDGIPR